MCCNTFSREERNSFRLNITDFGFRSAGHSASRDAHVKRFQTLFPKVMGSRFPTEFIERRNTPATHIALERVPCL